MVFCRSLKSKIQSMIDFIDKIYKGSDSRPALFDARIPDHAKGIVIFVHGYKGYKDWGCWNLLQTFFIGHNYGFVKFNMSHNGTTVTDKIDFPDLEAFGRNTYSKELFDLSVIVDETYRIVRQELNSSIPLLLLGHSRGGGIGILHASRDKRIQGVVSLAGICDIASRFPSGEELQNWQEDGVRFVENTRTKQFMPHYFTMYEDFIANTDLLNIQKAATSLKIPFLQIHGDVDTSVSIQEGIMLAQWTETELEIIKGADHTFGSSHPWDENTMPEDLYKASLKALRFFEQI